MFGLYVHIPYCVHKCFYCDFYSIENLNSRNNFARALKREVELFTENYNYKPKISTIFFGGGTPSLLKPHQFEIIAQAIFDNFELIDDFEWTMECNPGTLDSKYLDFYKSFGVNRLSFGVQSFNEEELKFLERIHSINDIYSSIEIARKLGFDNINIDLMFALPNQTEESWKNTLTKAVELETEHISAYSLIYEENTPLNEEYRKGKIRKTDDDTDYNMYKICNEILEKNNFIQYEVSNYSKENFKCKHNLNYWRQGEYFAFGPSAHSFLGNKRSWNFRSNDIYFKYINQNKLPIENYEILTIKELILERIYLELRAEGLNLLKFKNDFDIDLTEFIDESFEDKFFKKYKKENNFIKLTNDGYFVSDSITLNLYYKIEEKLKKFSL